MRKGFIFIDRSTIQKISELSWECLKNGHAYFLICDPNSKYENEPFLYLQLLTESQFVNLSMTKTTTI